MVRGDFGAIWRAFSAKLALRAAFFSKQDSAASAASNRRSSPAKMIRRRSGKALKLQFVRQFWIIIGKQSATGQESARGKFDPNLQARWTSGRRIMVLRTGIRRQKGESTGCAKFVSRYSSERLMKKERNFTNFDNRMPLFGSRNAGGAGLGLNLDARQ